MDENKNLKNQKAFLIVGRIASIMSVLMYVSYHLPRKMKSDLRLPFFIPVCAVARKPLKGR